MTVCHATPKVHPISHLPPHPPIPPERTCEDCGGDLDWPMSEAPARSREMFTRAGQAQASRFD